MSKTYRKYPIVEYRSNGVVYTDWNDIPKKDWFVEKNERVIVGYREEKQYSPRITSREVVYQFDFWENTPKIVKYPIYEWVPTGEWYNAKTDIDYESDYCYGRKTIENNPKVCKSWCYGSVGKYNKQLRSRQHRAQTKHVIDQWYQGNFDLEIPGEKNHDRWDYW